MSAREDVHIKGAQSKGGSFFDMRFIFTFHCLFVLAGAMIDWTFYDRPKLSNFRIGLGKLQKSDERMLFLQELIPEKLLGCTKLPTSGKPTFKFVDVLIVSILMDSVDQL